MNARTIVAVVLALISGFVVPIQTQQTAGSLAGIVVSDESVAKPVRRATVSLIAPDLSVPLSTVTGDDGRFSFSGVPPGHYGVVASKAAYVGSFFGSKRIGRGPGVPVAVVAGESVPPIAITLTRGAVIAGTLRLPSGEPALNMPVTAVALHSVNGVMQLRYAGGRNATDDRGQYRIFGLPPGEYAVIAQPSGLIMGSPTGINETPQTTEAEVSWVEAMARLQPGMASAADIKTPPRGRPVNYATVFFPGTPDSSMAVPVKVGPGEERLGVDFALSLVPTATVSGTVVDSTGVPVVGAAITLREPEDRLNLSGVLPGRAVVQTGVNGSFVLPAVAPGRYQVVARAASTATGIWAQSDVVVNGNDVPNVLLQLEPGLSVTGLVQSDNAAARGLDWSRATVTLTPATAFAGRDPIASGRDARAAPVKADGTFSVTGLVPAAYRIAIAMPGLRPNPSAAGEFSLDSIDFGGTDISDRTFDVGPGAPMPGLVARITTQQTVLTGTLSDAVGQPVSGYPIVVYPTDRTHWRMGSRRIAVARPATDGRFRLVGLPPGTYHLAAVVALESGESEDPAFLESLVGSSITVTLTRGVPVVQALRLK